MKNSDDRANFHSLVDKQICGPTLSYMPCIEYPHTAGLKLELVLSHHTTPPNRGREMAAYFGNTEDLNLIGLEDPRIVKQPFHSVVGLGFVSGILKILICLNMLQNTNLQRICLVGNNMNC